MRRGPRSRRSTRRWSPCSAGHAGLAVTRRGVDGAGRVDDLVGDDVGEAAVRRVALDLGTGAWAWGRRSSAGTSSTTGTTGPATRAGGCGRCTSCTTPASTTTSRPRCGSRWPGHHAERAVRAAAPWRCPSPPDRAGPGRQPDLPVLDPTEAIRRLGWFEQVFNTPSHHRVHHGSNRQYLDRNHGSILIIWDRLFGTFEEEDEPVVYGLTTNVDSFNR